MKLKCHVVENNGTQVTVYHTKGIQYKGKLVVEPRGTYYLREDGNIFPALCDGKGNWLAVVQSPDRR